MPIPTAVAANPLLQTLMSSASNSREQPSPTNLLDQAELNRKMEELGRQIAAQKQEIAGMLNLDEPYSPTSMLGIEKPANSLSNIAIPSNLQEILNSIKGTSNASTTMKYGADEEYDPTAVVPSASSLSYQPMGVGYLPVIPDNAPSKLAQLTDEELLRMVPDDMVAPKRTTTVDFGGGSFAAASVRSKYTVAQEPLPPGMDDEYVP